MEKTVKKSERIQRLFSEGGERKSNFFVEQYFTDLEISCITNVQFFVSDSSAIKCYWESFLKALVSCLAGTHWGKCTSKIM